MSGVVKRADEAAPPLLTPGDLLAPGYEVVGHLNRGCALDVYSVFSEERNCACVAKVLRPDHAEDEKQRSRLIREGLLLKRFTHLHIVRAYEVLQRPRTVVILETLTGETLEALIADRGRRLPLASVVFLGLHLCSAMHYLHRQGYLHLDLKPSNVVSDRGLAKVIDLSIAQIPGRGREGVGTREYMAPEQARGDLLSAATDAWGIGAVLFEAASGRPSFEAVEDEDEYQQLERQAESIRVYRRVPGAFAAAVDGCLEPEPARRPTIAELAKLLKGLV